MNSQQYFEQNKYVLLERALSSEICQELTQHMFDLHNQGKTTRDDQCPLSDAVYGDPVFDKLLADFAQPIGNNIGKKLLPTYTYARIYRPGEVLKRHTDRPACEISATVTLSFDAKNPWPIFVDEQKEISLSMQPGDMVVYRGCELVHWRPKFKGNWHVQVFLHYVDADGPYKDHALDKRKSLGQNKSGQVQVENNNSQQEIRFPNPILQSVIIPGASDDFPGYMNIDSAHIPDLRFTKEECNKILSLASDNYGQPASVGGSPTNSKVARSIRSANIFIIEPIKENYWIYEKVGKIISVANTTHFKYDITGITHGIQLIHYSADMDVKGHYDWHIDAGPGEPSHRKISFTAQLSDPSEYDECDLMINNHGSIIKGTREQGSIHLFPSYMLHQVTPITRGERYALVIWVHGPSRFR